MKILFIINALEGGGAERVVQTLSNYFVNKKKHEVVIVTLENKNIKYNLSDKIKKYNLKSGIINYNVGKIISLPFQAMELKSLLDKENPDVAMSFLVRSNLIHVLSRWFGNKNQVIISERTRTDKQYSSKSIKDILMKNLIKFLYPKSDNIIALSKGVKNNLKRYGINIENINVIYNPQDISDIREKSLENRNIPFDDTRPIIVTMGRLVRPKDHLTLLSAFKKVRKNTEVNLIIIGNGKKEKELKNKAKELNIYKNIWFAGWQDNPFSIINQCDIFVLSSKFEGFGNVIVEAMACGLPIISTDCPSGPSEILDDGKYGILVPVGNDDILANEIIKLLENEKLQKRYRKLSSIRAEDFDISVIGPKYLNFFRNI